MKSSRWLAVVLTTVGMAACFRPQPPPGAPGEAVPGDTPSGETVVTSRVALIHFYPALGELKANVAALEALVAEAFAEGARFVVAPELATTGYAVRKEEILGGLGLVRPFPELANLERLADDADGYLLVGLAEVDPRPDGDVLFNSVAVFGPDGLIGVQRKRAVPGWNANGDEPIELFPTPYGDFGTVVCADTFRPDWVRVLALRGADLLLVPANWWSDQRQVSIWETRARENGVWIAVANRWGVEKNYREEPPFNDMNDAPSAVVAPDGEARLVYRAEDVDEPRDKILYYDVEVPRSRIGNAVNPTYMLTARRPEAYGGLRTPREVWWELDFPGLPPVGPFRAGAVTYVPDAAAERNLAAVKRLLGDFSADIVVLPGLGVDREPIACGDGAWWDAAPWKELRELVDAADVDLLVTSAFVSCPRRLAAVVFRAGREPVLAPQIHDAWGMPGSGEEPLQVDLPHARVGVLLGVDTLFPEVVGHLARTGAEVLAVPSVVGASPPPGPGPPSDWSADDLVRTWTTRSGQCFHVAASDASGHGVVIRDRGGCYDPEPVRLGPGHPVEVLSLDTSRQRRKLLNTFPSVDLETLLGPETP